MMKLRPFIFHPTTVLCVSLLAILCFCFATIILSNGRKSFYSLYYVAPIGVPFIAFIFDRAERWREFTFVMLMVEVIAVGLSMARAKVAIPFLSGHALFLTYAILTYKNLTAHITAMLVMIEVLYLKLFVWHDLEVFGGILFGVIAGIIFRLQRRL